MSRKWTFTVGTATVIGLATAIGFAIALRGTVPLPEATTAAPATSDGRVDRARHVVQPLLDEYPGVAVAVVGAGGDVLWSDGFGYADIALEEPVDTETRFRIYSVSKPITAAAAARLAEQGTLDLDAAASTYLPELPQDLRGVTARQLIGHLSGVRHYGDGEWLVVSSRPCGTPIEGLQPVWEDALVAVPGTGYHYSTFGYVLLSAIMEAAATEPFEDIVRRQVLDPAGMKRTVIERQDITESLSTFYEPALLGRVREARPVDNSCKWGGGAYLSSTTDLARFGHAVAAGGIVGRDTRAMIFRAMATSTGESTDYAFGWGVGEDAHGRRYAAHSGGAIGGRAAIYLYPDDGLAVAIVGNVEGTALTGAAATVAELFAAPSEPVLRGQ